MTYRAFAAAMLAAMAPFALTACGKTPAASDKTDPAAQQTERQNDGKTSANKEPSTSGDEVSEGESVPTGAEEEPWKTALTEDLFEKYGVLPEYYEDLGGGIVPFVTVESATGDYHG